LRSGVSRQNGCSRNPTLGEHDRRGRRRGTIGANARAGRASARAAIRVPRSGGDACAAPWASTCAGLTTTEISLPVWPSVQIWWRTSSKTFPWTASSSWRKEWPSFPMPAPWRSLEIGCARRPCSGN
jgi:hypothetical protein